MRRDAKGMVDVGGKEIVFREAVAEGAIRLRPETIKLLKKGLVEKGDVWTSARIAAAIAAKQTPMLIPYTHPIPLDWVGLEYSIEEDLVKVRVTVRAHWRTGVEMEALSGAAGALLTIWDMVKKYEKDSQGQYPYTRIDYIRVLKKVKRGSGELE